LTDISLSLEIDNLRTGDHICPLGHLLHPNIEGITVDLVQKTHVDLSLGGSKYVLSCSIELSLEFHFESYSTIVEVSKT